MNSQIVTVNLVPGLSTPAVVRVSQYDVGRPILFKVMDGTMPASFVDGTVATVVGTKPSGLGFYEVAAISGNTVNLNSTLAMTQEAGMIQAEVRFSIQYGPDIGTANFVLAVEKTPHAEGTTDGTQETMANLETRLQGQIDALDSRIDAIEGDQSIIDDIDALDARVTALEQGGSGLSQAEKNLILTLFSKAAYAESDAESAYDALENLWTTTTRTITYNLSHVSSSNTTASVESGQSYTTTLTASTNYTLNSVTVTMGGVDITSTAYSSGTITIPSVTGNIVITATAVLVAQSITATYTQSGTVYDTDTLDSLKADLVVTANYAGGTSETVTDYTLSGTLTVGTSTITVSYAELSDTFTVTVTEYIAPTVTTGKTDNSLVFYSDADCQTQIASKFYGNYAMLDVCRTDGTATITITNETEETIGKNAQIYVGFTDRLYGNNIVKVPNSSLVRTLSSLGIEPGNSTRFSVSVPKGYKMIMTYIANSTVNVSGINVGDVNYGTELASSYSQGADSTTYYSSSDETTQLGSAFYVKNLTTDEAVASDTDVVIVMKNESASTDGVNANDRMIGVSTTKNANKVFNAIKLSDTVGSNPNLMIHGYCVIPFTIPSGYYLRVRASSVTPAEGLSIKIYEAE